MDHPWAPEYERSYGFSSPSLREAVFRTRVCVAGAGGGGALLAEWAAREGFEVRVADPDVLDRSNGGRVIHAVHGNFGRNKAEVVAEHANLARPAHRVVAWPSGVLEDTMEDFLIGGLERGHQVIAVDEIDLLVPEIAVAFARAARRLRVPLVTGTDIGYGGMVTSFHPAETRHTYERVNGHQSGGGALSTIAYLPPYGSLDTLASVLDGAAMPTTVESVLITTALCLSELRRITAASIGGYLPPTWAPRVRWLDCEWKGGSTRFPRVSRVRHLLHATVRDRVRRANPPAAYRSGELAERAALRSAVSGAVQDGGWPSS